MGKKQKQKKQQKILKNQQKQRIAQAQDLKEIQKFNQKQQKKSSLYRQQTLKVTQDKPHGHHGSKHTSSKLQKHHKNHDQEEAHQNYKQFPWSQVGKHDHKDDIWVVIQDNIYDVTKFVDQHPGGPKKIYDRAGKDATKTFHSAHHPPIVMDQKLAKFKVGRIQANSMIESWQREMKTGKMDTFCAIVLTVGLFGFSLYLAI